MKKNNKKGFTLVELVIVVAVMAILVAIAIPTVSSITSDATNAVNKTNCQTIQSMIKLAEAEAANDSDTGSATLDDAAIAKAIVEAKLGITTGKYYYNIETGAATISGTATAGKVFEISFSAGEGAASGTVTVKDTGTGTTYKLDGSDLPADSTT